MPIRLFSLLGPPVNPPGFLYSHHLLYIASLVTDGIYPKCNAKVQVSKKPNTEREGERHKISQRPNHCFTINLVVPARQEDCVATSWNDNSKFTVDVFILYYL